MTGWLMALRTSGTRFRSGLRLVCALVAGHLALAGMVAAQTLDIYFIDVEGGQATLIVTPAGQSMLIDAGYEGFGNRDPGRILAAAKDAGVTKLDYLLITHFHGDHFGGASEVARRLPVATFLDYGEPVEKGVLESASFAAYASLRTSGVHRRPAAGETIALNDVELHVVSSGGDVMSRPLPGASGAPNEACATSAAVPDPVSE